MAREYKLSHTASEVNEKLGKVDILSDENNKRISEIAVERARINEFTALADGSTTGDAELQDIRVGYDGFTYDTAGEAVRNQVAKLAEVVQGMTPPVYNNEIDKIEAFDSTTTQPTVFPCKKTGVWFDYRNGGTFKANANLDCYIFEAKEGDRFNISGIDIYNVFGDQYFVVPVNSSFATVGETPTQYMTFLSWCSGALACPTNTKYMIINTVSGGTPAVTKVDEAILPAVNGMLSSTPKFLTEQTSPDGKIMCYRGAVGSTIGATWLVDNEQRCFGLFPLKKGEEYTVYIAESGARNLVDLFFLDDDFVIVDRALDTDFSEEHKFNFIAQDNYSYIAVNCFNLYGGVQIGLARGDKIRQGAKIGNAFFDGVNDISLEDIGISGGQDVSTLNVKWVAYGDSITYYNTWQPLIVSKYNISEYVNSGIGGTTLAGTGGNAMCSDTRLSQLVSEMPDVITIFGGANDLMAGTTGIPIGDDTDIVSKNKTTFKGAYAYIIDYILTRLPSCRICLMGMFRAAYNNGKENPTNGTTVTVTYDDYNKATEEIADYFCLPFVDLNECGFNSYTFNNTKDTVLSNQYDYIHPNEEGGKRIAGVVSKYFSTIFE